MSTVTITEEPLGLESLLAIVDGARVELAEDLRAAIELELAVPRALDQNADGIERHEPAELYVL